MAASTSSDIKSPVGYGATSAGSSTPSVAQTSLSKIMSTPYLPWFSSFALLSNVPACVRTPLGYPQLVQLPLFALIFSGSGYMIKAGDPTNGSGTTTAWSLMYLFFHGRRALVSKRPAPIMLASTIALQAAIAGTFYFTEGESEGDAEDDERIGVMGTGSR